ncbi:hypothetical protein EHS25_004844 [Saitozyma podzolica]|uniref:Cytochrome b561 domain-containing protein n=1 Tax=Saitozyma podzolica TaxID=1890683 RepID=A0A427Y2U6_9TREE|nr:hypothetical protein EHS25_004844 [Saitozyma podzolica]
MSIVFDFHDRVIVVHGTAPAAIICARYMRHDPRWFIWHRALNIATVLLIVLVFALGTAAVYWQGLGHQFSGPYRDLHHDLGLGLFIVVVLQGIRRRIRRDAYQESPDRHNFGGQSWIGFDEWNTMQSTGTFTPDAVRYIFFIIMGIEVGVYLYGAGRAVIFQTAGDDGRGPWRSLAGAEKIGVPTSSGALC